MYKLLLKPLLDFLVSLLLLPLLIVLVILIGTIIYLEDKGGIFYIAPRLGYKGRVFNMIKFRTMKINSPDYRNEDGSTYNSEYDPRLTTIGIWIRKNSIDEMPQLFNVLLFQMSIIGPRPDLPEHINFYTTEEKTKLNVLPGITGFNQAYYRNSIPWKERLKNDIFYVNNIGFVLDMKIFFKTIIVVLLSKNIFLKNNETNHK